MRLSISSGTIVPLCHPMTCAGLFVTSSKGLPPLEAKCCRKTSQSRLSRLRHTSTGKSFWKDRLAAKPVWKIRLAENLRDFHAVSSSVAIYYAKLMQTKLLKSFYLSSPFLLTYNY